MILIYSIFYGITMKIADLLNEHKLMLFEESQLVFGFLWGFFGSLIILTGGETVANIILAMNLAFIIRNRLDYPNHQVASSLVIISFLIASHFNIKIFVIFYAIFAIFGSLKDYTGDILKNNTGLAKASEAMLYYPIPAFIYSIFTGSWMIFGIFALYTISYDITKYIYALKGYK